MSLYNAEGPIAFDDKRRLRERWSLRRSFGTIFLLSLSFWTMFGVLIKLI